MRVLSLKEWVRARFRSQTAEVKIRVLPLINGAILSKVLNLTSLKLSSLAGEMEMIIMMPL